MGQNPEHHPLQNMRILVADDEFLIVAVIEETLQDAGADVVSVATLAEAMESAKDPSLSAAILDVRLGRHTTEAVAKILSGRDVPFVFHSGQALPDSIRNKFPHAKMLPKPAKQDAFVTTILEAVKL